MKRFINPIIMTISLVALLCGITGLVGAPAAFADASADAAKQQACAGIGGTFVAATKSCTTTGPSINGTLPVVINILSIIVGIAAVICMIVAGFKYITSGGDGNKVASAKNTIVYGVIGIIVTALAQTLVKVVLNKAK
ncbi:MAG TPA: hypothetical protein VLH84_04015 [Patescibacteria group bacterium]|nr:hypothetical protein [Patescibacteria group bacterium]